MKWSHSRTLRLLTIALAASALVFAVSGHLFLPALKAQSAKLINYGSFRDWLQNTESGSAVEAALYRIMSLPTCDVLYVRPPQESRPQLDKLLTASSPEAALYSLRALQDEQALDFTAAENDWKQWVDHASDHSAAELDLAAFYARRLRPQDEIAILTAVAGAPSTPAEKFTAASEQRSWLAFDRILSIVQQDNLKPEVSIATYQKWIARYPAEPAVYSRYLDFLLAQKRFDEASALVAQYQKAFPADAVFAIRARASIAYKQGSLAEGLAVYDKAFQPLWPAELIQSYYSLLTQTHSLSAFLDRVRASLAANPDDLDSAARLFYAYQQQGRLDAARQIIAAYRQSKESRGAHWTAQELYTFARLSQNIQDGPEAARYYFALNNSEGMADAQQRAIAGLTAILLDAPEQPLRLGAGNLSMYRDIATMDQGPGYLNGILSLLLNTTYPKSEYATEDQLASPYFHRAKAAELLTEFDRRFPGAPERSSLHASLIRAYAVYGENDAVFRAGDDFLTQFPKAPERVEIALAVADADARTDRTQDEFAVYNRLLRELASQAEGVPLGDRTEKYSKPVEDQRAPTPPSPPTEQGAFATQTAAPLTLAVRSPQYEQVLDRYLARLVALQQLPQALTVLRGEVDHDPDDPGIYEKLAGFLDQNRLGEHEEEVYRRAIRQFDDKGWYAKLARYYIRGKRAADYASLTEEVAKIFSGTELESYLRAAPAPGSQLSLEVNLYAHKRFPHDLAFTTNLLTLYSQRGTSDSVAWQKLLSEHWFENASLRNEFFEYLSRTNKLDAALSALRETNTAIGKNDWPALAGSNPAAENFFVEAQLWQSHFEESAPAAGALAAAYPADVDLGLRASSLYRSLAYLHPSGTTMAVAIEKHLLDADPANLDTLARIGDIYADRSQFAAAAPYWLRMAEVHPGEENGYRQSATVFWDYFDFDNAFAQIEKGRRALAKPALLSYEAGAIYENQRDHPKAIAEYVRGSVTESSDQQCRNRLLVLARRPALRQQIEQETASLVTGSDPSIADITLRVDILNALERRNDAASTLDSAVARSSSFDALESIEQLARQHSFVPVQQHAIERQIAITTDPVHRLELRYNLVHFYEDNGQLDAAQHEVDALYQENPEILGIVRATIDYDWAHNRRQQAIEVLNQAAKSAYPELRDRFRYEAVLKLNELGQYAQARTIATNLLKTSPHNAAYLAAAAGTYARAGDNSGLRDFYQAQVAALKAATMDPSEKKDAIAALRRGLIPALMRLKDNAGAADQYIELISAYPDDESLTTEAALFAMRYGQQEKLASFYTKTVNDSPRDSRWMMVLARIETTLENYPAAIDAYTKAIVIRPDRVDLYIARAGLDEKLERYEAAASDYEKLYPLSYKDPSWLQKEAEACLRQGKPDQAVTVLKAALLGRKAPKAGDYFATARQLESWNLLQPAQELAEKGVELAGDDLLSDYTNQSGAAIYVRILTRLRKPDVAFGRLSVALEAAGKLPGVTATITHAAEHGVASVTEADWREQQRQTKISAARTGFVSAMREMAAAAYVYDTPEETQTFVQLLRSGAAKASDNDLRQLYLPAVESASFSALEAEWEWRLATSSGQQSSEMWSSWAKLQRERLLLTSAGRQLEAFATNVDAARSQAVYASAAEFYRDSGQSSDELRVLEKIRNLNGEMQERYFSLLLAQKPQTVPSLAATGPEEFRDAATQYAVLHAPLGLALETVNARGNGLPPVWPHGYNALTGYYLRQQGTATDSTFRATLGDGSIAERLAAPIDRNQQLAGDLWFYYGARYGEYLSVSNATSAADYLPAPIEARPESASAYLQLAEWYTTCHKPSQAIAEYDYALQLLPNSPSIYDSKALLLLEQGKKAEAIETWKKAVSLLLKQIDMKRVPESFWTDFARIIGEHGSRFEFSEVRPQIDATLRTYMKRNGAYMTEPLLRAIFQADGDPREATSWIIDLSSVATLPSAVLEETVETPWLPISQKPRVYAHLVELARDQITTLEGEAKTQAQNRLRQLQVQWINTLIKAGSYSQAVQQFDAISKEEKKQFQEQWLPLEMNLAAHSGTIAALIEGWKDNPASAPPSDLLRNSASSLDRASKNLVFKFVYWAALDAHDLSATNFLGLAEIEIQSGNLPGATALLQRMILVSQNTTADLDTAASLLTSSGHYAESLQFLKQLIASAPWQPGYRLRLDEARLKASQDIALALDDLASLAANPVATYTVRTQAAQLLTGHSRAGNYGSQELNLLARGAVTPSEAQKPGFIAARMDAAKTAALPERIVLLKEVIADAPHDDTVRIQLVKTAIEAKDAHLSLSAASRLLGDNGFASVTYNENAPPEMEEAINDTQGSDPIYGASQSFNALSRTDRVAMLSGIAAAYQKIDELGSALACLQQAIRLEQDATRRKEIAARISQLRHELARRATNAARAPQIHSTLDQNHLVRPRLQTAQEGREP